MEEELRPCPFCGSKDVKKIYDDTDPENELKLMNWQVCCARCECKGPLAVIESKCIPLWNKKA